ncbi:endolytic transglycosylase MltG [Candidatus Gracilibacteria bacterium]|nr:endolytic transglycosylase MltG [Candidatus Gracilibacteria bacterium]
MIFTYLVWSVGLTLVPAGKYIIDRGYTISTLNSNLGFGISPWRYRLWIRFFAPSSIVINAGTYETLAAITVTEFVTKTIKTPLYIDQTITILPGWSSYDIDTYLASKGIGSIGDFLEVSRINFSTYQSDFAFLSGVSSLEGFLYPDTYRLRQDATLDDAIRVMLREFDKKIGKSYTTLKSKEAYEALILASIVEREERDRTNQPIVAGILAKRVAEGIAMGADATVCYGYAKTQKQCTPSFIGNIIQAKNPYNTRNKLGYPPTPIANVPVSAWTAALNPETSPYYYYLHGSDGQIHYGRSNDEHIANKKMYLK